MTEEVSLKEFLEDKLNFHTKALVRIESQVNKTNGRVTSLEKWRYILSGAFAMLTGLVLYSAAISGFIKRLFI